MIDLSAWLPGLPKDDDEQDPVSKTLAALGQGVSSAVSAVADALPGAAPAQSPAPTYTAPFQDEPPAPPPPPARDDSRLPEPTLAPPSPPEAPGAQPEPARAEPSWIQRAIQGLPTLLPETKTASYAPRRLEPGEQSTAERLPGMAQAGVDAAASTLGDRGAMLAGLTPPQTAMEVIEQAAPAPVRGLQIGREVLRSAGGAALEAAPQTTDPLFTTNEIQTPLGTLPSMTGPTPQQAGRFVGEELADPTNYLSFGAVGRAADAPVGAALGALGRGARRAARVGADRFGAVLGEGRETAQALNAAEQGAPAYGAFGALPAPDPRRGVPTVEAISEQLSAARDARSRAVLTGDAVTERAANDHMRELEDALADAVNARRALEPAITSDIGRRVESLPLAEETADTLSGAGARPGAVRPEDVSGPVGLPVDMAGRANASAGALPAERVGADRFGAVNRVLSQGVVSSVSGGVGAQVNQELNPDDPYAGIKGFAAGALVPPLAQRGARALARAAGAAPSPGGGALATIGGVPGPLPTRRGPPAPAPPPGLLQRFPGVQGALTGAAQRAATMQANGLTTPTGWEVAKQLGYSGIFGPATATGQVMGGVLEVGMAQEKEALRALTAGPGGRYGAQVVAQLQALPESLAGLSSVVMGRGGSAGAAARSGGSQGTAKLSERIVNPLGHAAARVLEKSGEFWAEAPDAIFRPIFTAQGMRREADTIARELGQGTAYADTLMQTAQNLRAHPGARSTSAEARRVVDAGTAYADELGYKGDPGKAAAWLAKQAGRNDAVGLAASYAIPFPGMAGRTTRAALRMTPGVGLLPGVRAGRPLWGFDTLHDQAVGAVALAGMGTYAANGGITGSGPDDPEKRKQMMSEGWQPRSTLVGDHYVPNRLFQRFGPILDAVGEAHDVVAYAKPGQKGSDYVADAGKRLATVVTDQTGLSGLSDLYDLFMGRGGLESGLPGAAARAITRYTPFGGTIRAAAQATDPEGLARKPETWDQAGFLGSVGQQLEQNVPGLRGNVDPAQDVLGRPLPNPQQGLGALFPRTTTVRDDPTISTYQEAGIDIGAPPGTVSYTPKGGRGKGVETAPVEMTPEEQQRWNTYRGAALIDEVERIQRSAFWTRADRESRQDELRAILTAVNKDASSRIIDEMGRDYDRRLDAAIEGARTQRGLAPAR